VATPVTWDSDRLGDAPRVFPASGFAAPAVEPLFYEGEPYLGRPTRVFAWMGLPYTRDGAPCPGMVLLHGGGGTAFDEWVRIWNRRGYAAIAMDLCGCVPERSAVQDGTPHERHEHAGPAGWDASFEQTAEPVRDQWTYHAVAAAIRGRALLASQPGVDPGRIGLTGISWGGYLACIVAGADPRFGLAVPVYGCGFLGRNSVWNDTVFPTLPRAAVDRWLELWDPSVYLPGARMPLCWVTGTNDFAYPMDSLRASALLAPGERTMCVRVEMPHGHEAGWRPDEIGVAADAVFLGAAPLPHVIEQGTDGRTIRASFESARPIVSAEICFTRAAGMWQDRKFNRLPATLRDDGTVEAPIPPATTVAYLNVTDDRGCVSSSPHEVLAQE
jgi:dienelactone hydrolase